MYEVTIAAEAISRRQGWSATTTPFRTARTLVPRARETLYSAAAFQTRSGLALATMLAAVLLPAVAPRPGEDDPRPAEFRENNTFELTNRALLRHMRRPTAMCYNRSRGVSRRGAAGHPHAIQHPGQSPRPGDPRQRPVAGQRPVRAKRWADLGITIGVGHHRRGGLLACGAIPISARPWRSGASAKVTTSSCRCSLSNRATWSARGGFRHQPAELVRPGVLRMPRLDPIGPDRRRHARGAMSLSTRCAPPRSTPTTAVRLPAAARLRNPQRDRGRVVGPSASRASARV